MGRDLQEAQVGVSAGIRLGFLPKASLQATYTYALVEHPLPDISVNRRNAFLEAGYALRQRVNPRATGNWQRTHGGLRAGLTGNPFPLPGELNTPERFAQRNRVLRSKQVKGGLEDVHLVS